MMDAGTNPAQTGTRGRILIMDDEQPIRTLLTSVLEAGGYQVDAVRNGEEAIHRYQAAHDQGQPFDLVILDLQIPNGMGGMETVDHLLKLNSSVKVVASSGSADAPSSMSEVGNGFCAFLSKPYRLEKLEALVARFTGAEET